MRYENVIFLNYELMRHMYQFFLNQPDELWTWDSLYSEITSCPKYNHIATVAKP